MSQNIRPLLIEVETRLAAVTAVATADSSTLADLQKAWNALVQGLDLQPEPKMRACPTCSREIRSAATLCGFCWSRVTPIAD